MKRMKYFLIIVLLLAVLVCAKDFEVYEGYIEKSYTGGQFVKGVLNMSFDGQENSRFESNFEGGIELYGLLGKMNYTKNVDFTCEPVSCEDRYVTTGEEIGSLESRSFSLNGEKILGFAIGGGSKGGDLEKKGITSFEINITSDMAETRCDNQISFDLFDDGVIDFYNFGYVDSLCGSKKYGGGTECYDESNAEDLQMDDEHYCIKIKLPAAPAFRLGAKMKKGWNDSKLAMKIYKLVGDEWIYASGKSGCYLDLDSVSSNNFTDIDCIVNYSSVNEFDAFVCIWDQGYDGDKTPHLIREDDSGNRHCGGIGIPSGDEEVKINSDFSLYAVPLKYNVVGKIKFDAKLYEELHNEADLYDDIEDYISEVYEMDCEEECVIPFSIEGLRGQQITLDAAKIKYEIEDKSPKTSKDIHDIKKEPFLISSDEASPLALDIEKMRFKVPNKDKDGQEFWIKFDGDKIIDDKVSITKGFEFTIGPRFALIEQNTQFTAYPSQNMNITGSVWRFTDSVSLTSINEKSAYTYVEEGEHEIEVTLIVDDGREATKRFIIVVGEPQLSAQLTLNKYKQRVIDIEADIAGFDDWIKNEIKTLINLEQTKNSLTVIENSFKKLDEDDSDEKFIKIINDLVALDLPKSVDVVQRGTLPGQIGFANIDVDHIATISGKSDVADIEEELIAGIISWSEANYDFEISFESIAAKEDFGDAGLLNRYKVSLIPKTAAGNDEAYLIVDYGFDGLDFKQNYDQKKIGTGEGTYINLGTDRTTKNFEFLIAGAVAPQITSLGVYISPKISALDIVKRPEEIDVEGFPWGFFLIALIILIVVVFVAYIVLQEWYKRYYEKSLFKNPDNLYNIINFIYNSRASGIKDGEIRRKLLERKWKKEQVNYAFRKIDGKRTGMWEIPLFKFFENKKVKKEIQKKHPGQQVDARFIKRPNL